MIEQSEAPSIRRLRALVDAAEAEDRHSPARVKQLRMTLAQMERCLAADDVLPARARREVASLLNTRNIDTFLETAAAGLWRGVRNVRKGDLSWATLATLRDCVKILAEEAGILGLAVPGLRGEREKQKAAVLRAVAGGAALDRAAKLAGVSVSLVGLYRERDEGFAEALERAREEGRGVRFRHGASGYRAGCRCGVCREKATEERVRRRRGEAPPRRPKRPTSGEDRQDRRKKSLVLPKVWRPTGKETVSPEQQRVVYRQLADLASRKPYGLASVSVHDLVRARMRVRLLAMVGVVLETGARSAELRRMRVGDLPEDLGRLPVRRQPQNASHLPEVVEVYGLREGARNALRWWLAVREELVAPVQGTKDALWVAVWPGAGAPTPGLPLGHDGLEAAYSGGVAVLNAEMAGGWDAAVNGPWVPLPRRMEQLRRGVLAEPLERMVGPAQGELPV